MILPPTIPIFPLPNVVLFPNVFLPLHIFESRYRAMVKDALAGDRIIGMVLLQPGFEANYEGRPPVYPVGCAGVITHSEPLPDGRFNIVLRGTREIPHDRRGREPAVSPGHIEAVPEVTSAAECATIKQHRQRLEALLAAAASDRRAETRLPSAVPDQDLVNALAQYRGVRAHRTAGAARVRRRAVAMPGPHRAARNEDHGRAWCELGRRVGALRRFTPPRLFSAF